MTDAVPVRLRLRVDGRVLEAEAGQTVAAALANAGIDACRVSAGGERRGPLCAMGICWECRVTIDGEPHVRACMTAAREGMAIETGAPPSASRPAPSVSRVEPLLCDVAVVGGGPAGVAAACRAAEAGASAILLDENAAAGGQIYRRRAGEAPPAAFAGWIARLERSGARVLSAAAVYDAFPRPGGFRLFARMADRIAAVSAARVVLATGARERFLPFPGWTLPGVMGAAGAQAMWKSGTRLAGRAAVGAGTGPLLLAAAASLAKAGARLEIVAEQAPVRALAAFALRLAAHPRRLLEAARYRATCVETPYVPGWWIAEARGAGRLESVVLTDGVQTMEVPCELAAVGWGLVPNRELPLLFGCATNGQAVAVDDSQRSSVPGVFCAGETCGVAGVEVALAEGEIAGAAAAGAAEVAHRLRRARESGRRLARGMDRAFALRPELRALAGPDTIVCRCEDAARGPIAACADAREAKLVTRAGMGPCQGRVCGPALQFLFGWDSDTVRPPVQPASLGELAAAAPDSREEGETA
ncbi:MAG TPA: 2Fe-2S iron-sulfur cluster-binding protein [Thermoanaerobaculia bacterium]|jgi:thioredoxin reductase|nr:2Fe-2S iron-sulfur cluster-binding protein [Thermoanaerobaculia bacterium]